MSSLRSMLARLARLEERWPKPSPPLRIIHPIVDGDGWCREVRDDDWQPMTAEQLAELGITLPMRSAPGWRGNAESAHEERAK